jgi:outer membrane receptor protein involved in Fe transport
MRGKRCTALLAAAVAIAQPASREARAHDESQLPAPPTVPVPPSPPDEAKPADEVQVRGAREEASSASQIEVGARDLELRPRRRPGDVLEAVPGLFAVQHSGGGKANQYFLRGFDADHGTDVAFFVDGIPINLPSHGHGQGFSDFGFLIPELVVAVDATKGPYWAQYGDFDTAGAVNLRLAETLDQSVARYEVGAFGVMRGLVLESPKLGDDWRAVVGAELYEDDGPFVHPEKMNRFNLYGRATHDLGARSTLSFTWMSYGATWHGSGQIPARAVCGEGEPQNPPPSEYGKPCIDRFDAIDPSEGGQTQRHMAQIAYTARGESSDLTAMLYAQAYRFQLFSNFTFFADDAVRGDEIEQDDDRTVVGADVRARQHAHYGPATLTTTLGLQARHDSIDNGLWHDETRTRLEPRVLAGVEESELAAYVEEDARLAPWIRFVLGARADRMDVAVDNTLAPAASGSAGKTLLSPKWRVVVSPAKWADFFVDYGRGFHSNDARGAVLKENAVTLLTPATGYEVGARVVPVSGLSLSAAGFLLDLDSELVWNGDTGTTTPAGATRRYGGELSGRYRMGNWLFADVDGVLAHGEFRVNAGNGSAIALAPTRTLTAGVGAARDLGRFTPFGGIRVKAIGDRPATQDATLTAQGFVIVNAEAGVRWRAAPEWLDLEVGVDVQNLFDAKWREAQFATTTRLAYEPVPVTGIHYTPGWPRTIVGHLACHWR